MKQRNFEYETNYYTQDLTRLVFMNIVYFFVLYVILNCLRIFISTQTVSNKLEVKQLTTQESILSSEYRDLLVERSLAYDMNRIENIAVNNYGMVLADNVEYVTISETK